MPPRAPGPPPGPPLGPPLDPALVWRPSSSFFWGSSLSSLFNFQYPASVFLGSASGFFLAGGAGGGGGNGCEGGRGPAGACAKSFPGAKKQIPQRTAAQVVALNLVKTIFAVSPRGEPAAIQTQ